MVGPNWTETLLLSGEAMVSRATCGLAVAATVAGATISTEADADLDVSTVLVAVIMTLLLCVAEGAVNLPV